MGVGMSSVEGAEHKTLSNLKTLSPKLKPLKTLNPQTLKWSPSIPKPLRLQTQEGFCFKGFIGFRTLQG